MTKYLYAASIQGIQSFIFQTNTMKDIVGASELVDTICTTEFQRLLERVGNELGKKAWNRKSLIVGAAGNVKYVFDEEEKDCCKAAVSQFPIKVMGMAPGITISQAVAAYDEAVDGNFGKAVDEVEARLKAQRNRLQPPYTAGLLGIRRAPGTGLPAVTNKGGVYLDLSTQSKRRMNKTVDLCMKSFYGERRFKRGSKEYSDLEHRVAFEISDMCGQNDWLAVIHADGNSLGKVVLGVGHDRDGLRRFSSQLNNKTILAANDAFRKLCRERGIASGKGHIPIRPIVLGGDDMTVIIRGDLAMDYLHEYMGCFETRTRELQDILSRTGRQHLTVCAGIAFIKSSFPFYYGYNLAESLCAAAKDRARSISQDNPPSCLMFHKVQYSFFWDYHDIERRELTTASGKSFLYGPYYLNRAEAGYATIGDIIEYSKMLTPGYVPGGAHGSSPAAGQQIAGSVDSDDIRPAIRKWLGLLHENEGMAEQWLKRVEDMHPGQADLISALTHFSTRGDDNAYACMAYDALVLNTISNQQTRGCDNDD